MKGAGHHFCFPKEVMEWSRERDVGVASWGYLGLFLQGPSGGFHLSESAGIAPKGKLVLPNSLVSAPLKGVLSQAS